MGFISLFFFFNVPFGLTQKEPKGQDLQENSNLFFAHPSSVVRPSTLLRQAQHRRSG
tara:strand:+ start:773 stop:943 length:171 start_codon:yes stop_codon:yes gene_type:complete